MEKPQFRPEIGQKPEKRLETEPQEKILEDIVFSEVSKKDGTIEYRNSSPDRKIIILSQSSQVPEAGRAYRVRIVEDSKPGDSMQGKMIVEITLGQEQERQITELAKEAQELFAKDDIPGALAILEKIQNQITPEMGEVRELKELKEIFKEDFLGIEEAEKFSGRKFNQEELRLISEKWREKVRQQGLTKESLEQLKKEGFMVVLRSPKVMLEGKEAMGTIANLRKKFPLFYDQDWYDEEKFATEEVIELAWSIVKKELLEETRDKNWDEQEEVLKEWAKEHKVDPKFVSRRKAIETIYDVLAYYEARKARLLERDYDWSKTESSGGSFVCAGAFDSDGLGVDRDSRGNSDSTLGVCPAR
ncbi:MAG: hypothetical protein AAB479_02405 [Patescibacteria group bacterium]